MLPICNPQETSNPIMCSYKLVRVKFELWGLQTRVESFVHKVIQFLSFNFNFIVRSCTIFFLHMWVMQNQIKSINIEREYTLCGLSSLCKVIIKDCKVITKDNWKKITEKWIVDHSSSILTIHLRKENQIPNLGLHVIHWCIGSYYMYVQHRWRSTGLKQDYWLLNLIPFVMHN